MKFDSRAYKKAWRAANRERLSAYHLRYYHAHKDHIKAKEKAAGTRPKWQASQTASRNFFKLMAGIKAILTHNPNDHDTDK